MDIPLEGIAIVSGFLSLAWICSIFCVAVLGSNAFQAEMFGEET